MVSIRAIATFQALHDYLRPRVSGLLSSTTSRLSGMLAALAASGLAPGAASRALAGESLFSGLSRTLEGATASSSSPEADSGARRRRSLRLSAKKTAGSQNAEASDDEAATTEVAESSQPAPVVPEISESQLGSSIAENASAEVAMDEHDSEFAAEFTDDEVDVDAEVLYSLFSAFQDSNSNGTQVFEEESDPDNSVSEKTITVSVGEGKSSTPNYVQSVLTTGQMVQKS